MTDQKNESKYDDESSDAMKWSPEKLEAHRTIIQQQAREESRKKNVDNRRIDKNAFEMTDEEWEQAKYKMRTGNTLPNGYKNYGSGL